jgi:hypothetical protein
VASASLASAVVTGCGSPAEDCFETFGRGRSRGAGPARADEVLLTLLATLGGFLLSSV